MDGQALAAVSAAVAASLGGLYGLLRYVVGQVARTYGAALQAQQEQSRAVAQQQERIASALERHAAVMENHLRTLYEQQREILVHVREAKTLLIEDARRGDER